VVIVYGCCVGNRYKLMQYVLPHVDDRLLYTLTDQTSIVAAYNEILDHYADRPTVSAVVLLHDDLEIMDPDFEQKIEAVLQQSNVGLIGVAGGKGTNGLAWWNTDPIGHQKTDAMNIDFGTRTGDVDLLEGSLLVFSRLAAHYLRFDPWFPGFHGYDEIGRQSNYLGLRNVVADIDTWHHNSMGFKNPASHEEWLRADQLYREKWGS
jgi:Glycosyltransferase like family